MRVLVLAIEWLSVAAMTGLLVLTWVSEVPLGTSGERLVASAIALGIGLWARSIGRSHDEGRGFDRARGIS